MLPKPAPPAGGFSASRVGHAGGEDIQGVSAVGDMAITKYRNGPARMAAPGHGQVEV
jgi:hypothetical protein